MDLHAARPYKILFAVSVIIPVMLFSFMMWQDYNSILKEHKIEAVRTAKIFQQHALNVFEIHQLVAERIDERLKDMTWDQIERSSDLRNYLSKIEKEYPQVLAIWLADSSGIVRNASKALPAAPVNVSERDYFQALSRKNTGLFIGHIIKPKVMTNLNFNVAYRRNNSSELFDGVVIVTVVPEYFGKFWNQAANVQDSATLLIRSDGAVLARSLGIDPDRLFLPPDSVPMQKIRNVREGLYIAPSVHDGTRRIYGFHKLDKYNVFLLHGIKAELVIQEWQQHLLYYGSLFSIAMIILVLLILSAQRHSKNVHAVQEDMRRTEMALKESEFFFKESQRAASIGSYKTDFIKDKWESSEVLDDIFGVDSNYSRSIQGWLDLVHPDDRDMMDRYLREEVVSKRTLFSREYRIIRNNDGETRWVLGLGEVKVDGNGIPLSLAGTIQDITERKRAEEALQLVHEQLELRVAERTEQLEAIVEILLEEMAGREKTEINLQRLNKIYTVLSETNQTIVRATSRESLFSDFCRIAVVHGGFLLSWVGLLDHETGQIRKVAAYGATGYLDDIQISSNDEPLGLGPTGRSVRDGAYHICNDFQNDPCTRPWREQGEAYGICSSASIALKEDGKVIGSLTLYAGEKDFFDQQHEELLRQMGEDVSFAIDHLTREEHRRITEQALRNETLERLRTVEALRKQELLLIQQNRHAAMGEMIGNIAHQWRQPLNTLGLLTQRLGFLYDSPVFNKEFLGSSVAKSMEIIQYMSLTIDDFRNFFSTDREKTEFSSDVALDKALSLVEASFKENGIGFERGGLANVKIFGYLNEYAQVLINIFINAKDVLKERNVEFPIIKIVIGCENGISVVTITDNAGGIQEEIMEKIFDPYFSTKGPQQGTGIGLFMSKTIIENNMDGRLSVCNTDEGAEFRIEV